MLTGKLVRLVPTKVFSRLAPLKSLSEVLIEQNRTKLLQALLVSLRLCAGANACARARADSRA